jgi:parallel beta-helix repeat protein
VNVRDPGFGARGDGLVDDTAAIQKAVDTVAGSGGKVFIPAGTYRVNALTSIRLKSDMTLSLAQGAVLKAIPNGAPHSSILKAIGVEKVNILGGTLMGERAGHGGKEGEWGHGLTISGSQEVTVEGVTARECWGDGFYVSSSSEVTFCRVVADHNRRQGMSITSAKGLIVRDSTFMNTAGTLPEDGLDVEPNPGETVEDVLIAGCRFIGNAGFGIEVGVPSSNTGRAWIRKVVLDSNTCEGSGVHTRSTTPRAGIEVANCAGLRISNNLVSKNGLGILLRSGANDCAVTGNIVSGNTGDGIVQYLCTGNTIAHNRVVGNKGLGIQSSQSSENGISHNTLSGNRPVR